ncbi:C-type mannose receptor 2-like [Acanthochromis polyacanthus]|uniref:C-type mannose receptor 2-like n=1 Tax=Acanthochromis polyacanthus TaxID=80966 RepID=UPI00223436EA|nr:C-type mannose receptor 2-like [Acanthochromis polyacanthus]
MKLRPTAERDSQTWPRIGNTTEMNRLIDTLSSTGYNSEVWIGAFAEVNWRWSDGSRAEYRFWADGEPNYLTSEMCVATSPTGPWESLRCDIFLPMVCYKGTQQNPEFVSVVSHHGTWSYSQKYCRDNYIDLATVRNEAEYDNVFDSRANHRVNAAWIGLFRDPVFNWSEWSSFVFRHFDDDVDPFGSDKVFCGASSLSRSGKWSFLLCERRLPFVCNTPAVKRVVKLRIKLDDSCVDLNDPAVKAALLKKLQDRLEEEGVSGVTLKWREQPDGEVWHKEDL